MYLASRLWKMKTRSQVVKTRINRILYSKHGIGIIRLKENT